MIEDSVVDELTVLELRAFKPVTVKCCLCGHQLELSGTEPLPLRWRVVTSAARRVRYECPGCQTPIP